MQLLLDQIQTQKSQIFRNVCVGGGGGEDFNIDMDLTEENPGVTPPKSSEKNAKPSPIRPETNERKMIKTKPTERARLETVQISTWNTIKRLKYMFSKSLFQFFS